MMRKVVLAWAAFAVVTNVMATEAYLEGFGAEYVDLGYCSRPSNKVVVDFSYTKKVNQQCLFGNDYEETIGPNDLSFSSYQNGSGCYAFTGQDGKGAWQTFNGNAGYAQIVPGERRLLTIDLPNKKATLTDPDGTFTYNTTINNTRSHTNEESMLVFAAKRKGTIRSNTPASARLYSFKLYEGGTLIKCLLPYRNGTTVGLRDVLSGTVFANCGAGAFSALGDVGIYTACTPSELAGLTLAEGYQFVGNTLVDTTTDGVRVRDSQIEFRVRVVTGAGSVSLDGTSGGVVEKWYPYGQSQTVSVSATPGGENDFVCWTGDTAAITSGTATDASVTLTVTGPTELSVRISNREDVFADATTWLRGPVDANGDGRLQSGELISALGGRQPYTSLDIYNDAIVSNEWVQFPYRGGKRFLPTLYFPQTVTITNAELKAGKGRPSTVVFNNFTSAAGVTTEDFSLLLRFRPDQDQFRKDYQWLLNWGYGNKASGFNIGLRWTDSSITSNSFVTGSVTNWVTHRNFGLQLFKQAQTADVLSGLGNAVVRSGFWHDLVVSLDRTHGKIRAVLCRSPWDPDFPPVTQVGASDKGGQNTWSNEVAMTADVGFSYVPTASLTLGSESSFSGDCVYTNNGYIAGNYTKCFRGSFHQIATWNRALTFDEMKAAMAASRPDVMRVGVRDGRTGEFRGGTTTEQDAAEWTLPSSLSAGESATVKFVTDRLGEHELTEMLRAYVTSDSATGKLQATLNGFNLGVEAAEPGRTTLWTVRGGKMAAVVNTLAGGTNTLVIARTDAGAGAVKLDALALGGSWQIGHKNSTFQDFALEGYGQNVHEVLNGNFYDIKRVLFGSVTNAEGKVSSYTNTIYKFRIPAEYRNFYRWRVCWKDHITSTLHFPRWRLNGHDFDYTAAADSKYHQLLVPGEWLTDGDNLLEVYNAGVYKSNQYYSLDYMRFEIIPQRGMVILVR